MNIKNIIQNIAIMLILIGASYSASAESGTITISDDEVHTTYLVGAYLGQTHSPSNTIYIDVGNYNYLSYFDIYPKETCPYTFVHNYESTPFTISSGGTGNGYISYTKNTSQLRYIFNSEMVVTSSPLVLTLDTNILNNISYACYGSFTASAVDDANPITVKEADTAYAFGGYYTYVTLGVRGIDSYTVDYPFEGYFRVNIDKNPSLDTRYIIHGSDTIYDYEPLPYNKNDIVDALFEYSDGLYLNVTMETGVYTDVLINSTGSSDYVAPTPTPTIDPITGGGILWDKTVYNLGDTATVSYAFNDAAWLDFLYSKSIEIYDSSNNKVFADGAAQSGYITYKFPKTGAYTAKLQKYLFGLFSSTYDEESTVVIALNNLFSTQAEYSTNEVVYIYGNFSAANDEQGTGILRYGLAETTRSEYTDQFVQPGSFNLSYIDLSVGRWYYTLYSYSDLNDCTGTTGLSICYREKAHVEIDIVPTTGVLNISWAISESYLNKYVAYNFSNVTTLDTIKIINPAGKTVSTFSTSDLIRNTGYSHVQYIEFSVANLGVWEARIINGSNSSDYASSYLTAIMDTGANITNSYSAKVYWGKDKSVSNSPVKLYWNLGTIPTEQITNATIRIENIKTGSVTQSFVVTADGDENKYFSVNGVYQAQLWYNGTIISKANLEISDVVPTATLPLTTDGTQQGITDLLGSMMFWAFLLTAGMMIAVGIEAGKYGYNAMLPMVITGFLGIASFTMIGWIPAWIMVSTILVAIVAFAWQQSKNTEGG